MCNKIYILTELCACQANNHALNTLVKNMKTCSHGKVR